MRERRSNGLREDAGKGKRWMRQGLRAGGAGFLAAALLAGLMLTPAVAKGEAKKQKTETKAASEAVEARKDWTEYPIVAHALGSVDGRAETNSKDAFLAGYEAGQRVFEVDLQLTSDGRLVARHDWDQISYYNLEQTYAGVMDRQTFLNTPICFYYTPLDVDGLIALMKEYPDIYFVTDSKDTDKKTVQAQMKELDRAVREAGDPDLWDRIIIQIYHKKMYSWVKETVPAQNWIFTLYQIEKPNYRDIGEFCREKGIAVVTMVTSRLTKESKDILHDCGCKVYLHTVNRLREMLELSWGADGFYSDCVTPAQLEGVLDGTNRMYLSQTQEGPVKAEGGQTE